MLSTLAQEVLRTQAETLAAHLDGAKARRDIEDVHQVRVAARRIRAALAFFGDCFDQDRADQWRSQLKKLLKRFGPARDCDVQIAFLENTLADKTAWDKRLRPGVARLLLRLRQRRKAQQPKLIKAARRLQAQHLTINLQVETERLAEEVKQAQDQTESIRFYDRAQERIARRLAEVMEKHPAMGDPADHAGHHALRIAVKKLRYTLELCDTALQGRLKKGLKRLKKLQTLLGDLHDCDVWAEQIDTFIVEETERTEAYYGHARWMRRLLPGLRHLQRLRRQERERLFNETAAYTADLQAAGFWNWITEAVKEEPMLPDQTDDADEQGEDDAGQ